MPLETSAWLVLGDIAILMSGVIGTRGVLSLTGHDRRILWFMSSGTAAIMLMYAAVILSIASERGR